MANNSLTKYERVILFSKRGIAWIVEHSLYNIVVLPICAVIFWGLTDDAHLIDQARNNLIHHRLNMPLTLLMYSQLPFLLFRDIVGNGTSLCKRFLGLEIIHVESDYKISRNLALMIRNGVMFMPLMIPVEMIIMLFEKKHQRRIGDYWASTIVVSKKPSEKYWVWLTTLSITIVAGAIIGIYINPFITMRYFDMFL